MAGRAPSGRCACSPLLTGEAQVAAQQLPVANLLAYEDLKRAILQRVGRNPEQQPSTLPLRGTRGLRPTICDGSAAPGRLPQVAHGRTPRRRGSDRPGGAGAVRRPTTPANSRVGPVPPPDVAGTGHPAGGGPYGGVPRASLSSPFPPISLSLSPCPSSQVTAAGGPSSPTAEREWPGGPPPFHRTLSGNPLPILLPLGRR